MSEVAGTENTEAKIDEEVEPSGGNDEGQPLDGDAGDEEASVKTAEELAEEAEEYEMRVSCAMKMQSLIRKFIARKRVLVVANKRYEKILDPKTGKYFYYDAVKDYAIWVKPYIFLHQDCDKIAQTYLDEEAATMVQRNFRRQVSLKAVRKQYREVVRLLEEPELPTAYYYNPRTFRTYWDLPTFMNGIYDYPPVWAAATLEREQRIARLEKARREKEARRLLKEKEKAEKEAAKKKGRKGKKRRGDESDDDESDDDSGEEDEMEPQQSKDGDESSLSGTDSEEGHESDSSEDTAKAKSRRVAARKFPRSHAQMRADAAEDNPLIVELDMSHFNTKHITSRIYDMTTLKRLYLSHNQLSKFSTEMRYLTSLEILDIGNNQISSLPLEIDELLRLRTFKAGTNLISTLPGQFFKLTAMQELDLSNNKFSEIPVITGNLELLKELKEWDVGIGLFKLLSKLDLSHNNISAWPAQLENLIKMSRLNLSHNKLTELSAECLAVYRELSYFNCGNNKIKSFPSCLYDLPLHYLNFENNEISDLAPCAHVSDHIMRFLTELHMAHNKLSVLDHRIGMFNKLIVLDASYNEIESIDDAMGIMTHLATLNLSHNRLSDLPATCRTLKGLTNLDLSYNKCVVVPPVIGQLMHLTNLNVSHNQVNELNSKIFALSRSLKTLYLEHNEIPSVPTTLFNHTHLTEVNCSNNALAEVASGFSELILLKNLYLSHNRIVHVADSLNQMSVLDMLDLTDNHIEELPEDLSGMVGLRKLWLVHNRNREVPKALVGIPNLLHWNMSWNHIPLTKGLDLIGLKGKKKRAAIAASEAKAMSEQKSRQLMTFYIDDMGSQMTEMKTVQSMIECLEFRFTDLSKHRELTLEEEALREQDEVERAALPPGKQPKKKSRNQRQIAEEERQKRALVLHEEKAKLIIDWHGRLKLFFEKYNMNALDQITGGQHNLRNVRRNQLVQAFDDAYNEAVEPSSGAAAQEEFDGIQLFNNKRSMSATDYRDGPRTFSAKDVSVPVIVTRTKTTKILETLEHRVANDSYTPEVNAFFRNPGFDEHTALLEDALGAQEESEELLETLKQMHISTRYMLIMNTCEKLCHDLMSIAATNSKAANCEVDRSIVRDLKGIMRENEKAEAVYEAEQAELRRKQAAVAAEAESAEAEKKKGGFGGMFGRSSRQNKVKLGSADDGDAPSDMRGPSTGVPRGAGRERSESSSSLASEISRPRARTESGGGIVGDSFDPKPSSHQPDEASTSLPRGEGVGSEMREPKKGRGLRISFGITDSLKRAPKGTESGPVAAAQAAAQATPAARPSSSNKLKPPKESVLDAALAHVFDAYGDHSNLSINRYKYSHFSELPCMLSHHQLSDPPVRGKPTPPVVEAKLFKFTFEIYMNYSSILLKQVDMYTSIIREVEKVFKIKTVIPLAQRKHDDLEDFAIDEYEAMKIAMDRKDNSMGANIRARKEAKQKQKDMLVKKAREMDKASRGVSDEEQVEKPKAVRVFDKEEDAEPEPEPLDYSKVIETPERAKEVISYLNQQRYRAVLYGWYVTEHLNQLLRQQGWDGTCVSYTNVRGVSCVDHAAVDGKPHAIRVSLLRGHYLQHMGLFDSAVLEYDRARSLAAHMHTPFIEQIKCLMSVGNYVQAEKIHHVLLLRSVPLSALKKGTTSVTDMKVKDLFPISRELAFMKLILDAALKLVKKAGVGTCLQERVYDTAEDGLMNVAQSCCFEVRNARRYTADDAAISYAPLPKVTHQRLVLDTKAEVDFFVKESQARESINERIAKTLAKVNKACEMNHLAIHPPPKPVVVEEVLLDAKGRPYPPTPQHARTLVEKKDRERQVAANSEARRAHTPGGGRGGRGRSSRAARAAATATAAAAAVAAGRGGGGGGTDANITGRGGRGSGRGGRGRGGR